MKRHTTYLTFLFFIFCFTASSQQKYSGQLFSKPLYMNAAYAGSDKAPRLIYSYHSYASMGDNLFKQNYASFDIGIKSSGFGAEYLHINEVANTQIMKLSYAYEINAGALKIRPAVSASIVALLIDNVKAGFYPYLVDSFTGDTFFFPKEHKSAAFSAGAGLMAVYNDFTVGFYVDQFNKPVIKYSGNSSRKLNPQVLAHADYKFKIGKSVDIIPGLVYYYNNQYNNTKGSSYFDPSLRVRIALVELGLSRMFSKQYFDITSLSAGVIWKNLRLKYSYSLREGPFDWTGADHEISFSASLKKE